MQDDSTDKPPVAVVPLDDVLLPGTLRVRLPDETKDEIREAVKGVARPGRRRAHKDDVGRLIASIEDALTLHLQMRGRWPRGPYGAMRPATARDIKPAATRTDYTEPLKIIAKALDTINAELSKLPTDGIASIEDGADEWLWFHARIEDEYPSAVTFDAAPNKTSSAITDDSALERYKFLLRLEAFKHGVEFARERAVRELPANAPKNHDRPRLVRDMVDAYERYLGRRPTSDGSSLNTPALRVCRAVFDWLGKRSGERRLSDSRLHKLFLDRSR